MNHTWLENLLYPILKALLSLNSTKDVPPDFLIRWQYMPVFVLILVVIFLYLILVLLFKKSQSRIPFVLLNLAAIAILLCYIFAPNELTAAGNWLMELTK